MLNLAEKVLRVGTLTGRTNLHGSDTLGPDQKTFETPEMLYLLDLLNIKFNLSFQLVVPQDNVAGLHFDNGTWNGLIGLLLNKEIDIAAARVPFLPELREAVDFSVPLGIERWVTLQQQPLQKPRTDGLLTPFNYQVWIVLAVAVCFMGPVMFGFYKIYSKLLGERAVRCFRGTLDNFVMFVCVSLIRQDHNLFIRIHSQRILMATWWIVGLLLTNFYTANLTASLARPFREPQVHEPRDLLLPEYQHRRWVTLYGGTLHALIREPQNELYEILQQHLRSGRGKIVSNTQEAIKLVQEKDYVWFGTRDVLLDVIISSYKSNRKQKNLTSSQWCEFSVTENVYLSMEFSFAFPRKSPAKNLVNKAFRTFRQAGLTTYMRRDSTVVSNPCALKRGAAVRPLKSSDFFGLFALAGGGILLGILSFTGERFRDRDSQSKSADTSPTRPLNPDKNYVMVNPVVRKRSRRITRRRNSKILLEDINELLDYLFYKD